MVVMHGAEEESGAGCLKSSVFSLEWKAAKQTASEAVLTFTCERDEQILQQFIPSTG